MKSTIVALLVSLFIIGLVGNAFSQADPVLPHKATGSLIVSDTTNDVLYRCTDLNLDGDYQDTDEFVVYFYAIAVGSGTSRNPIKITCDAQGAIYYSDTSIDSIVRLIDTNGNGHCDEPGDFLVVIDDTNASGVDFSGVQGMAFDTDGKLYLVDGSDLIAYAKDLTADGDFQDAGEIVVIYDPADPNAPFPLGAMLGAALGADGYLYISDTNWNGTDVIWRVKDLNNDDDIYDAGELSVYYQDTDPVSGNPLADIDMSSCFGLAFNHDGILVMGDVSSSNGIGMALDGNGDNDVNDLGETWWYKDNNEPNSANSVVISGLNDLYWDVYVGEGTDDSVYGMRDMNADFDVDDLDEWAAVYEDITGPIALSNPKGVCFLKGPYLEVSNNNPVPGEILYFDLSGQANQDYTFIFGLVDVVGGFLYPPYGVVGVYPIVVLPFVPIGPDGEVTLVLGLDPSLTGMDFHVQCAMGDAYLTLLSNTVTVDIQ
jgi:hypothetical protein